MKPAKVFTCNSFILFQQALSIYDAKRVDHWYRFAKQRLHWTLPNLRTPEQSERWSDLMPLMSSQLWLVRDLVVENVLPWQSANINLTPGRVAQSMLSVLVDVGTRVHLTLANTSN